MALETLEQFKKRVYGFEYHSLYMDQDGRFYTNSSLNDKVDEVGKFKSYIGNTIVFTLDSDDAKTENVRKRLTGMQDKLYAGCGHMLAERLNEDTYHMTLHDLVNGRPGGVEEEKLEHIGRQAKEFTEERCKESWIIRLKTTCVFNMVNSSVVLGLEPVCESDCQRLMELYRRLDEICYLGYPLTPHITLAYYKPGVYHEADIKKLQDSFNILAKEELMVEFTPQNIAYQEFLDMNHYYRRK